MSTAKSEIERLRQSERQIAGVVVERLAETGDCSFQVDDILADDVLRHRDLALLGLSSLDWMRLATRLEAEFGVELSDAAMLDPARRSVAGWAADLCAASVQNRTSA